MTAEQRENQQAAAAQAAGEAASARHLADTQAQHATTSGSAMAAEHAAPPTHTPSAGQPLTTPRSPRCRR